MIPKNSKEKKLYDNNIIMVNKKLELTKTL